MKTKYWVILALVVAAIVVVVIYNNNKKQNPSGSSKLPAANQDQPVEASDDSEQLDQ